METLKKISFYLFLPFSLLLGALWFVLTKNTSLRSQLENIKEQEKLKDHREAASKAAQEARNAKEDLLNSIDEFRKSGSSSSER